MPEMDFGRAGPPPALVAEYMRQIAAQQEARRAAGPMLYRMFPTQGQPNPMLPSPPPGTPQGGPQAPPPGANFAQPAPGGMPTPPGGAIAQPAPAPQAPRPQIQPFRPLPTAMPGGPAGPGGVPPPPSAAPQQAATPAAPTELPGKQFDVPSLIRGLQSSGVPPEKVMDMLDTLTPVMTAQNKAELEGFKAITRAQAAGMQAFAAEMRAMETARQNDIRERAEERRRDQGQQRLDQMKARAAGAAGGGSNIKNTEFIYPRDASGKIDQAKDPIGTRSVTKSGKIIYLDSDGVPTTAAALAGGTPKEDKATRVGVTNVVRQNIVKAGVKNSLARLGEIEQKFPEMNTSAFFGTHGENPATRAIYGQGRSMMSSQQKQADALWSSFIDEAIPVFTGGLRGSDAFRRFLIEQAPGPGDDKASRAEKIRLLRANIDGTSKAFFDKFASDQSMWGTGITQDQVDEARTSARAPASLSPSETEWKVEKVSP